MKRTYESGISNDVANFIGIEVEKTVCYGMLTYFIVGVPNDDFITDIKEHFIEQIYFGANHSFKNWQDEWTDEMVNHIQSCLDAGYYVTIDVDLSVPEEIKQFLSYEKFSITYAIPVPNIDSIKGNINIKLDDIDFAATNVGVWSVDIDTIKSEENFTDWSAYKNDKIVS